MRIQNKSKMKSNLSPKKTTKKKTMKTEVSIPAADIVAVAPPLGEPVITKWHPEGSLHQIYSSGLEYAFVNQAGEQCHPFAFCKDYLQDAIWATIHKSSVTIHGFHYTHGKNPPLDLENTRIALRLKGNKDFKNMCAKSLNFIRAIDAAQGFEPTELLYGGTYNDGSDEVYVFVSDKRWMYSTVLISLYTLILRVGMTYEGSDWRNHFSNAKSYLGCNDKSDTASATKGLDKFIGKPVESIFAKKMEDNYPKSVAVSNMHHRSGAVCFGNNNISADVKVNWTLQ